MPIPRPAGLVLRAGVLATMFFAMVASPVSAEPAPAATTTWLCQPGQQGDPCGGRSGAPVDCFYVYPTASLQQSTNANFDTSPELRAVAALQAAPFGENCNVWAPVYRQTTLRALFAGTAEERTAAGNLAYADIENAWDDYLEHHNNGRGVVLIGHSQGTFVLRKLIADHIDGQPAQSKLVSALLIGGNVLVRKGEGVGGDFDSVPACTDPTQTGCVVAYSAFSNPAPEDARFGLPPNTAGPDVEVLCTNPGSLRENADAPIRGIIAGQAVDGFRARCTTGEGPRVLMVDGPGASLIPAVPAPNWGIHQVDMNVAQRDLVDLVGVQGAAYDAAGR
ncbi:DUF3089 domain-containing protein [Rhodococcus sp. BP22]|uniref:DUF3089 domain-containing protein n=1 Tax=Rhodococcus sp. BP22 TaxID=2758566 RepID=UPI0028F743CE|nr:DUF3089 domain-containing protein [Rhodococcus sp. BP22]